MNADTAEVIVHSARWLTKLSKRLEVHRLSDEDEETMRQLAALIEPTQALLRGLVPLLVRVQAEQQVAKRREEGFAALQELHYRVTKKKNGGADR